MALPEQRRSLSEDWDEVRRVGYWVAFAISLPTMGVNALILGVLQPGKLDVNGFFDIVKIFFLTAPLCASVVVLLLAVQQPWFRGYGALFATAGIFVGGVLLGSSLGYAVAIPPERVLGTTAEDSAPAQSIDLIMTVMVGYIATYGLWTFIQSYIVGAFLAWAIPKLAPHFA